MTVLRSRVITSSKTTPHTPKSKLKLEPSTPAKTHESATRQTLTPPITSTAHSSSSKSRNPNPNSNPNPKPASVQSGADSVPVTGVMRRRSLRLASKCPDSSAEGPTPAKRRKTKSGSRDKGTCSAGVEVVVQEEIGEEIDGRVSNVEMGFDLNVREEKVEVDEVEKGLSELGLSAGLGSVGVECEEVKKKRKLEIDINLPASASASECDGEEWGSQGFLSLRSGKRVVKGGVGGGGDNGELGIDLNAEENGSVKSKGGFGRAEKGKGKLGESVSVINGLEVVELDSDSEVERSSDNVFQSNGRSGDMVVNENGVNKGRMRYSREEKGKEKLVGEELSSKGNDDLELGLELKVLSSVGNLIPGPVHIAENVALEDERQVRNTNTRENENKFGMSLHMQRFRNIARKNASRFAHFTPEEEEEEEENNLAPQIEVEQEIEDWPGPFSTAMKIIKDRAAKNVQVQSFYPGETKPPLVKWVPKNCHERASSKKLIPSLQELCLSILAKNADEIASLENVPDALRHRLSQLLCASRKMNIHFFELLVQGSPTEVRVRDCSWMTEDQFTESFQKCDTSNLTVLQLDLCGRCMPDYILRSTLARSSNCLPALTALSLSGAYRLSDVGLRILVSSAPALRALNLSQCSLLTSSSINTLADSLGSVLRELYLNDCDSINAMLILPALKKLEHLEVLWLAGIENVCDEFISDFITAHGHILKELVLTDCVKLTDSSVKVIAETCSGLCSLDLGKLYKLTDFTLGYLANGCGAVQTLKFCRNAFSDEAIAAFLETSGDSLKELSLSNVKKVGHNTAISLARHSRKLHTLDLSWCQNLTDEALGLIVDSCLSLRILNLSGCTQITNTFLDGHSNPDVRISGLKFSPILEEVTVPDFLEGPLRYS